MKGRIGGRVIEDCRVPKRKEGKGVRIGKGGMSAELKVEFFSDRILCTTIFPAGCKR